MSERFNFGVVPPLPGARHYFYGQPYMVVAVAPWRRRDGTLSAVVNWLTACASCGQSVTFRTGIHGKIDVRRCKTCIKRRQARFYRGTLRKPTGWRGT